MGDLLRVELWLSVGVTGQSRRLRVVGAAAAVCLGLTPSAPAALVGSAWDAGNGNWNNAANWNPVVVPNNGADTYNVTINTAPGATVTLDISQTIEDLTIGIDNQLQFLNNRDLLVNGNIVNDGLIEINGTSSTTDLVGNNGNLLISGTGELVLDGSVSTTRVRMTTGSDTLTNGSGHTISGRGNLGVNLANFVNNGTIKADVVGATLRIDPLTSFDNNSTLRAENEGILDLNAGEYDNTGGTITADGTNAVVQIGSQANITGGSFNTVGDGLIRMTGNTTLTGVTNNGSFSINSGIDPTIAGSLTNNGTFTQAGTGANTAVQIDGSVTVSGTGTWRLNNAGTNINTIQQAAPDSDLTNAAGHTIAGAGNLGTNQLGLTNHGLILADQTNRLDIDPADQDLDGNGTDFINSATGVLRATGDGTLRLIGGTYRNDNIIEAVSNGGVEYTGATIVGGTLHTATGSTMNVIGNSRFEGITLDAGSTLDINNGIDPVLSGIITNNGTINSNGTGANTATQIDAAVTLTGNGEFVLGNAGTTINTVQRLVPESILTQTANHTISGAGGLGNNALAINNAGTIRADQINRLDIDPDDQDLDGNGADVINSGLMHATGGGTLRLQGGRFANQTVIRAEAGSEVQLSNGAYIDSGTLNSTGDGVFRVIGSAVTLDDITLTGTLNINNSFDPFVSGTFTNQSIVNQNGTGANTAIQILDNVTFNGGGQWVLGDAGTTINTVQGSSAGLVMINETGHTFRGAGNIGANQIGIVNKGLIQADHTNFLVIDPADVDLDGSGSDVSNTGTIRAAVDANLRLQGGVFKNQGFITAENGATVEFSAGANIQGGSLQANGDGAFRVTGSGVILDNITLNGTGGLSVVNGIDPFIVGTFTNNVTVTQLGTGSNTAAQISGDVNFNGNGQWVLNNAGTAINTIQGVATTEQLTNGTSHTIRGAGAIRNLGLLNNGTIIADLTNALVIQPSAVEAFNNNLMQATGAGGLQFSGLVTNVGGGTIEIDAGSKLTVTAGTFTHEDGATLTQNGDLIVSGGTFLNEASDYSPGASPGQVTVNGSGRFKNDAGATVLFELDGATTPGVDYDTIRGTGIFELAGTIDLDLNFSPNFYESIELIRDTTNGNGVIGTFDDVAFDPIVAPGDALAITYSTNAVLLTRALPGDANLDGFISQGDLDAVLLNWGSTTSTWQTGEFTGDDFVSQADLDIVLLNWGSGTPPVVAIPEPSSVALLGVGSVALFARRRQS